MATKESESQNRTGEKVDWRNSYLQKFRLYETQSRFYMIGRNKSRTTWRVLKIDRLDPSELNISEDSTIYSQFECSDLLNRIHEGNRSTGGLKFVTTCYGIVGFIKFLGPHYMLLIKKRREIGDICGHKVYAVAKSELIPIPNSTVQSKMVNSKNENRYKKLLCTMDLTKDFFFSYSYNIMCNLQKNLCDVETGQVLYETMFVWNEFLTRGIRNHLKNTLWTVALVYGFFEQAKLSISGIEFMFTLIARRSRHYAGTRYLKRGVNEKGRVANDVETEQIVFEDVSGGYFAQISSVVQNRGSIPLFWSQYSSRLNIKPDIIVHKKDVNFEATRLHFENLVKRYGNSIIILNLIKTSEKKPRESILHAEFSNAIQFINKDLSEENQLKFLHWDLNQHHKHHRSNATEVLPLMCKVTTYALNLTSFFYCQVTPTLKLEGALKCQFDEKDHTGTCLQNYCNYTRGVDISETRIQQDTVSNKTCLTKPPMFQKGVLRTNCIDCLDRTNVAQCVYGWAGLCHQLHALGYVDVPEIDSNCPLANDLIRFYERMGDTLARQYGGSAAHNKIFSERRGQWKATIRSQEVIRILQRYYNNAYVDAEKQNAMNVFLGHFQPQQGEPTLWELDSYQHYNAHNCANDNASSFKRSLSDGNLLREGNTPGPGTSIRHLKHCNSALPEGMLEGANWCISDFTPEIFTRESDISNSRYTSSRTHSGEMQRDRCCESDSLYFSDQGIGDSNFLDLGWLSSSGNSCEEEPFGRPALTSFSSASMSTESPSSKYWSSMKGGAQAESEFSYTEEFSESFLHWILQGETLFQ